MVEKRRDRSRQPEIILGEVAAICASRHQTEPKVKLDQPGCLVVDYGLIGDAHAGLSERQISLLSIEAIEDLNREHQVGARPGSFAENITTCGMDLSLLAMGQRLAIGEAILEVVQVGKPPTVSHTYNFRGFSLLPTKGVFCKVVESGKVCHGDLIRLIQEQKG